MSSLLSFLSFFSLSTDRPLRDPIELVEKVVPFLTEDQKELSRTVYFIDNNL